MHYCNLKPYEYVGIIELVTRFFRLLLLYGLSCSISLWFHSCKIIIDNCVICTEHAYQ